MWVGLFIALSLGAAPVSLTVEPRGGCPDSVRLEHTLAASGLDVGTSAVHVHIAQMDGALWLRAERPSAAVLERTVPVVDGDCAAAERAVAVLVRVWLAQQLPELDEPQHPAGNSATTSAAATSPAPRAPSGPPAPARSHGQSAPLQRSPPPVARAEAGASPASPQEPLVTGMLPEGAPARPLVTEKDDASPPPPDVGTPAALAPERGALPEASHEGAPSAAAPTAARLDGAVAAQGGVVAATAPSILAAAEVSASLFVGGWGGEAGVAFASTASASAGRGAVWVSIRWATLLAEHRWHPHPRLAVLAGIGAHFYWLRAGAAGFTTPALTKDLFSAGASAVAAAELTLIGPLYARLSASLTARPSEHFVIDNRGPVLVLSPWDVVVGGGLGLRW